MKKDIKQTIKRVAKLYNIPLTFYRYKSGECSCCYWPEWYTAFINTNNASNWCSEAEYYKINYNENKLEREWFNKFVSQLKKEVEPLGYSLQYDESLDFWVWAVIIDPVYIN